MRPWVEVGDEWPRFTDGLTDDDVLAAVTSREFLAGARAAREDSAVNDIHPTVQIVADKLNDAWMTSDVAAQQCAEELVAIARPYMYREAAALLAREHAASRAVRRLEDVAEELESADE